MRFTLRNQHKIKEVFSEKFLQDLLGDLKVHFKTQPKIEQYDINLKYPIIEVPRKGKEEVHIFYVYGGLYDVLNLAYKETIKK